MDGLQEKKYLKTSVKRFDPFALLTGFGILGYLIYSLTDVGSAHNFWDLKSMVIVLGGTVACLLIQYDFVAIFRCLGDIFQSFRAKPKKQLLETLKQLDQAILNDIDILELREASGISGDLLGDIIFMQKSYLSMEEIENFVASRIEGHFNQMKLSATILQRASLLAPSLGLFGTAIGLVTLLKSFTDPAMIGPSMSLALLTTAYGSGLATLIFNPLAGRVEEHNRMFVESHRQLLAKVKILLVRYEKNIKSDSTGKVA